MAQPSVHGRFIWQELMTDDTAAAAEFYSKVVGWRVQSPAQPNGDYRVFAAGRHEVGGVMSLPEHAREAGARPHWLPYIGVDDVDGTVSRIEQLGGKVLRAATDVQDVGRYAVLADPQGAAFGIYRPDQPAAAAGGQPSRGEFAWQELATSDFEAAFRFYAELFGWQTLQRMDMGPAGTYLIFGRDGVRQGGIYKLSAQTPAPYWLSYISVAQVDAVADEARKLGARVVNGPMDVPDGGRIAQLLDGSGVLFAVHSQASAAAHPTAAANSKPPAKRAPRPTRAAHSTSAPTSTPAPTSPPAAAPTPSAPAPAAGRKAGTKTVAKKQPAKKAAKKAAKNVARTAATKAAKKAAKKAAPRRAARSAGKSVRKAPKKAAKRAGRRTAGKTGGKRAKKVARKASGKSTRVAGRGRRAGRGKTRGR